MGEFDDLRILAHKMDEKFTRQKGKVLMITDNCSAHPEVLEQELESIGAEFLPPNTTSKLHPMDQRVIENLKHWYKNKLMRRNLRQLDIGEDITTVYLPEYIYASCINLEECKTY